MIDLDDPIAVLLAVERAMRLAGHQVAAYGGLVLAVYGEPRETRDADLAVVGIDGGVACAALRIAGLDASLSFDRVRFGGNLVSRVALVGGSALNTADFVEPRSARFARSALERAPTGKLRDQELRLLSPEDFVLFKVLSTRDRDLEDAVSVVRACGEQFDPKRVEAEARLLSVEIPDHDVTGRLARVLTV